MTYVSRDSLAVAPEHLPVLFGDRSRVERLLNDALRNPLADFLEARGKRVRSELAAAAYELAGGRWELPGEIANFIDDLHAGSLIIDDVEDQSLERRGRPTLHREVGASLAVNAGNWLYFSALEQLVEVPLNMAQRISVLQSALRVIRLAHEGQAMDLEARVDQLEHHEVMTVVHEISSRKTAELIGFAARLGGIAANATSEACQHLHSIGWRLGMALQMQNDFTELESAAGEPTPDQTQRQDDLLHARVTWPWAWASQQATAEEYEQLRSMVSQSREEGLSGVARRLLHICRAPGRREIEGVLGETRQVVQDHFGESHAARMQAVLEKVGRYRA